VYLAGKNEIAFELIFDVSFFGVRFPGPPTCVLEPSEHYLICLNNALHTDSFIAAVGNHPFCGELCHGLTHVKIGAVNAWKSVGSYHLPKPAQSLRNIEKLWAANCATQLMGASTIRK
jgi:hypothetical protein